MSAEDEERELDAWFADMSPHEAYMEEIVQDIIDDLRDRTARHMSRRVAALQQLNRSLMNLKLVAAAIAQREMPHDDDDMTSQNGSRTIH